MRLTPAVAALTAALVIPAVSTATSASTPAPTRSSTPQVSILAVHVQHPLKAAARLQRQGYDLVEARSGRTLYVVGDAATRRSLTRAGYDVTVSRTFARLTQQQQSLFYGGYKTADEYAAGLDAVAVAHPDLAVVHDVGDSWKKVQNASQGNDLKAICITKLQPGDCQLSPGSAKPRFFLMATVHARELTATEVADRFVNELVTQYGVSAEVTAIVDNTEVWVLPLANPDGREIAEPGAPTPYLQRKNANNTTGSCAVPPTVSNQHGVDINRNHSFLWGGVGTSSNACDQTYKGVSAASEPETQALQTLMGQLFADNRGPNITDAAPLTTPGMMLTLHSYGNLVLIPWGHTNTASPNNTGLRNTAFRLNYYNGYTAGQPGQVLYNTSGTSDDWAYGTLGVAGATVEIGPSSGSCGGFVPAYSCQAGFWNTNRSMLMYAAKLARQPYTLSLGPNTTTGAVSPATVAAGTNVTLTATGADSAYGTSGVSRPSSQRVTAGQYFLDVPPWAGGTAVAMTATDGNFNSTSEGIRATVNTTGLSSGVHYLYVQARDLNNNWGPVTAVKLTIS